MQEEADAAHIERAKRDPAAFGDLYRLYLRRIYAFCLAHSAARDEAEDLTAQTFERALRALPRYQSRGAPLSSWLFRIASNLVVDQGRRRGRTINLGDEPVPEPVDSRQADNLPAVLVERWERAGTLSAYIASLPADQQLAIQFRYGEDQTVPEVAARMGRSEGATKQLLRRALRSLRERLEYEGVTDV